MDRYEDDDAARPRARSSRTRDRIVLAPTGARTAEAPRDTRVEEPHDLRTEESYDARTQAYDMRAEGAYDTREDDRAYDAPYDAREGDRDVLPRTGTASGHEVTGRMTGTHPVPGDVPVQRRARTSVAAALALVFGVTCLCSALVGILAPLALLLGVLGLVLGLAGVAMGGRPGITGRGLAVAGIVLSLLGLALAAAVFAGLSDQINDVAHLDTLQSKINELRVGRD